MNNIVISRVTNQRFIAGKSYECTSAYASGRNVVVDVVCETKELIQVCVNDPDYEFYFINVTEKNISKIPYIRGRYNSEYGDGRKCKCGHPYAVHFDSWDDMEPVGCKYCGCIRYEVGD